MMESQVSVAYIYTRIRGFVSVRSVVCVAFMVMNYAGYSTCIALAIPGLGWAGSSQRVGWKFA